MAEGRLSFRQAAEAHNVPKSKYHGENIGNLGRPPVLNKTEEEKIVVAISYAALAGFPFTPLALRKFVQDYLNRKGVLIRDFDQNLPGIDWVKHFLK